MSRPRTRIVRILTIFALVSLVLPLATPVAAAQLGGAGGAASQAASQSRSVGVFNVAPGSNGEGRAVGAVTSAIIAEGSSAIGVGVIKDFAVSSGGSAEGAKVVFESIDVAGFQPVSRLEGVGTSALTLKSSGLVIGLSDATNGLLTFKSVGSAEQEIVFNTAADVILEASGAASNVWNVKGEGTSGALVLVSSKGQQAGSGGGSLALDGQHRAVAKLKQGTSLIYRANAQYGAEAGSALDAAIAGYNEAALKAIATGKLAGEATSEFSTGFSLIANANYFATATTRTEASEAKRVTTTLRNEVSAAACAAASSSGSASSAASGSAPGAAGSAAGSATATASANVCAQILAYDLDYVDVPAQTADQVAVYINGAIAQRVDAASRVAANADSYWATTVEGRVLVLTNVAAQAQAATQVTIAAVANAEATASTLAELDAYSQVTTQLQGGFQLLGNLDASAQGSGQVIGKFGSFFASEAQGASEIRDFTDIRTATTIFTKMRFAADVAGEASGQVTAGAKGAIESHARESSSALAGGAVRMTTTVAGSVVAQTDFYDNVYAAFKTSAEAATVVDLSIANDISARFVGDAENVLALDGPAGQVGHLILMRADGSAASASRFDLTAEGQVKAVLEKGEQLAFRRSLGAQTRAGADATAQAIAQGQLASEASVGFVANAIASAELDWQKDVDASIVKAAELTHKGLVTLDVVSQASAQAQATVVAVVADRATLAARSASDILVTVDGQAATAAQSASAVYAAPSLAAGATYYVVASLQGQTQVLVSIPQPALDQGARVVIESAANAEAKSQSALDVFGSFRPGYGGVATGDVVSLVAKPEAGLVLDYTLTAKSLAEGAAEQTTTVFDAVKVGGSAFASGSASGANSLRFVSDEATIEAFDVSSAILKVVATADTVAKLDLAQNIQATQVNDQLVMLEAPDFAGALILTQASSAMARAEGAAASGLALSASGDVITANLEEGAQVIFKAFSGFDAELNDAQQRAQAEAIARGALLGQVIVDTAAGASALTTMTATIDYYDDVRSITKVASSEKVEVLVDSASSMGKTVIISFDRDTVKGLIDGDAKLLVDGRVVEQAKSYEDAFVADADKYYLVTSEGEVGLQAIVTLAHFSTRTITIETPTAPSLFLWSTIGLGLVVVGQALYPRLRRSA